MPYSRVILACCAVHMRICAVHGCALCAACPHASGAALRAVASVRSATAMRRSAADRCALHAYRPNRALRCKPSVARRLIAMFPEPLLSVDTYPSAAVKPGGRFPRHCGPRRSTSRRTATTPPRDGSTRRSSPTKRSRPLPSLRPHPPRDSRRRRQRTPPPAPMCRIGCEDGVHHGIGT